MRIAMTLLALSLAVVRWLQEEEQGRPATTGSGRRWPARACRLGHGLGGLGDGRLGDAGSDMGSAMAG